MQASSDEGNTGKTNKRMKKKYQNC